MKIPHYVKHINLQTHCRAESPSSPLSLLNHCSPSLLLSAFHTLPHSLQHMPTHAAARAHVIWNCIFPSFSLLSLSHTTLSFSLLYLSLTCTHVRVPRGPDSHLNWAGTSVLLSSSLSFFILSAIQIKSTLYCLDRDETCAAGTEHYVIIWDSLVLTLTDGQKPKHIKISA